jgi:hypothetical protein
MADVEDVEIIAAADIDAASDDLLFGLSIYLSSSLTGSRLLFQRPSSDLAVIPWRCIDYSVILSIFQLRIWMLSMSSGLNSEY